MAADATSPSARWSPLSQSWGDAEHRQLLGWKAQEEVGQLPAKAVPLGLAKPPVQKLGPCRVRCIKGLKTSEQGEKERSRLSLHPGEEIESGKRGRRIPDERRQKH